jgi:cytochrome c oxidase cbb3-type subunit 3
MSDNNIIEEFQSNQSQKDKKDVLTGHNYDGIREYDNPLPRWWLYLFYFTIAWSVVYMFYYHFTKLGPSSEDEYVMQIQQAKANKAGMNVATTTFNFDNITITKDEAVLSEAKEIFIKNCVSCHAQGGAGAIGPNLTDDYWIHGGSPSNIAKIIYQGVPEKGMIAWKNIISNEQIIKLVSYIKSLRGTNPPNAKAPQGNLEAEN